MARRESRIDPALNGAKTTEDKMDVGDDRVGPAEPPWVIPKISPAVRGWTAAEDRDLRVKYPTLHDFLVLQGYGGKQRKTGSMNFFAEEGKFKVALNDREQGLVAFLSSDTFYGLLDALERGLKSGGLDWRESKFRKR